MSQFLLQVIEMQFIFLLVVLEIEIELHQHAGNFWLFLTHLFIYRHHTFSRQTIHPLSSFCALFDSENQIWEPTHRAFHLQMHVFSLRWVLLALVHTNKSSRCKYNTCMARETEGENQHLSESARRMQTVSVGAPCLRCGDSKKWGPQAWTVQPCFVLGIQCWRFLWVTANRKSAEDEIKGLITLQKAWATSWKVQ